MFQGTGVFYTSRTGTHSGVHTAATGAPAETSDALQRKLDDLHRAGLLSDEELAAKKAQLEGRRE